MKSKSKSKDLFELITGVLSIFAIVSCIGENKSPLEYFKELYIKLGGNLNEIQKRNL